jgi:hypothetical protein
MDKAENEPAEESEYREHLAKLEQKIQHKTSPACRFTVAVVAC